MGDKSNSVTSLHNIPYHLLWAFLGFRPVQLSLCHVSGDIFDCLSVAESVSEIFFKLVNIFGKLQARM